MEKNKMYLDKNSSVPLHYQLYKLLENQIKTDELKEGDLLLSEKKMSEEFSISRTTVRRALSDLENNGLIKKIQGKGAEVLPKKSDRNLNIFQSFTEAARSRGERPSSVILDYDLIEAPSKVIELLDVKLDEKVIFLERLRLINGRVIALNTIYMKNINDEPILQDDFDENTSVYKFIEENGIKIGSADETLEAKMPNLDTKEKLFLKTNVPILYKERITYSIDGTPIEFSEISYIADRYKYNIHLRKANDIK